jgi:thymidylate synthase (FAD)
MPSRTVFAPYGQVTLDVHVGSDLDVVNAAKVSTGRRSAEYGDDEARLLRFLMRERHGSPFEHNYFRFVVRAPMVVFWEWKRHRIASYNVESGRYVELRKGYYIPQDARTQVGKPGQYAFEPAPYESTQWLHDELEAFSERGFELYQEALEKGVAREQARLFIPMNFYVEFWWSVNARSLMNFLSLRNDHAAMHEIRAYAAIVEELWHGVMPDTAEAFNEFGRRSP